MSAWHDPDALDGAQDALTKMHRAHTRGTGCHLTADEIRSQSLTSIGEMWHQDDPRKTDDDHVDKRTIHTR